MGRVLELSSSQRESLSRLNSKLTEIEFNIKNEVKRLIDEAEKKISDSEDWIDDYEIECILSFILKENDPGCEENSDNILTELLEYFSKEIIEITSIADGINHNEFQHWEHPMKNEHHCWLYHALYDHRHLSWEDMLRIGSIWIDIKIVYQKELNDCL